MSHRIGHRIGSVHTATSVGSILKEYPLATVSNERIRRGGRSHRLGAPSIWCRNYTNRVPIRRCIEGTDPTEFTSFEGNFHPIGSAHQVTSIDLQGSGTVSKHKSLYWKNRSERSVVEEEAPPSSASSFQVNRRQVLK